MVRMLALVVAVFASTTALAKPLEIVASFTVLADVVRQVGGDRVTVLSLVPPNGDVHEFEPSPDHARALKGADLVFTSGLGLEPWFDRLARAASVKKPPVAVSAGIALPSGMAKSNPDPHVWNDPRNVIVWAQAIETALTAADPAGKDNFHARAESFVAKLRDADRDAHARIDPIPAERRHVLTSHDSLGWFARAYNVTILAPIGTSTDVEPSAAGLAKMIDQIKREQIKVYFLENSGNPRLVKTVASATGATPGGTLYVEALSSPGGPANTYLAMFRQNVDRLVEAMTK